ncbi:unnamed protein product [Dicrocoelium dendriticum]|nr:unnamed protein product [Dicrocoelium dendriticum]
MAKELVDSGLYIDELNKLRILDPSVAQDTSELKQECENYLCKIADFQSIVQDLVNMLDSVAQKVEKQKLKAIVSRNMLVSMEKQRETQMRHLRTEIEKQKDENERSHTLILN